MDKNQSQDRKHPKGHKKCKLPFDRYCGKGRERLETIKTKGKRARKDYGPPVFKQCGTACVYCGYEMGKSYRAWLNISVDHVIPYGTKNWSSNAKERWLENLANLVTCCRACNEFLQKKWNNKPQPKNDNDTEFFDLRDQVFCKKKQSALNRHLKERALFKQWRAENKH